MHSRQRESIEETEYRQWVQRRKDMVEGLQNICGCRIGKRRTKWSARTKCCRPCHCCHQRIKGDDRALGRHQKKCTMYQEWIATVSTAKPSDEIVTYRREGNRCVFCKKGVAHNMMEWHWRNNPECPRYQELGGGASMSKPSGG